MVGQYCLKKIDEQDIITIHSDKLHFCYKLKCAVRGSNDLRGKTPHRDSELIRSRNDHTHDVNELGKNFGLQVVSRPEGNRRV